MSGMDQLTYIQMTPTLFTQELRLETTSWMIYNWLHLLTVNVNFCRLMCVNGLSRLRRWNSFWNTLHMAPSQCNCRGAGHRCFNLIVIIISNHSIQHFMAFRLLTDFRLWFIKIKNSIYFCTCTNIVITCIFYQLVANYNQFNSRSAATKRTC